MRELNKQAWLQNVKVTVQNFCETERRLRNLERRVSVIERRLRQVERDRRIRAQGRSNRRENNRPNRAERANRRNARRTSTVQSNAGEIENDDTNLVEDDGISTASRSRLSSRTVVLSVSRDRSSIRSASVSSGEESLYEINAVNPLGRSASENDARAVHGASVPSCANLDGETIPHRTVSENDLQERSSNEAVSQAANSEESNVEQNIEVDRSSDIEDEVEDADEDDGEEDDEDEEDDPTYNVEEDNDGDDEAEDDTGSVEYTIASDVEVANVDDLDDYLPIDVQLPPRRTSNDAGPNQPGLNNTNDNAPVELDCVVCKSCRKDVLVLPCRHMCLCVNCAHQLVTLEDGSLRVCPLCRTQIEAVINVYM